jgi:hypothetical protein
MLDYTTVGQLVCLQTLSSKYTPQILLSLPKGGQVHAGYFGAQSILAYSVTLRPERDYISIAEMMLVYSNYGVNSDLNTNERNIFGESAAQYKYYDWMQCVHEAIGLAQHPEYRKTLMKTNPNNRSLFTTEMKMKWFSANNMNEHLKWDDFKTMLIGDVQRMLDIKAAKLFGNVDNNINSLWNRYLSTVYGVLNPLTFVDTNYNRYNWYLGQLKKNMTAAKYKILIDSIEPCDYTDQPVTANPCNQGMDKQMQPVPCNHYNEGDIIVSVTDSNQPNYGKYLATCPNGDIISIDYGKYWRNRACDVKKYVKPVEVYACGFRLKDMHGKTYTYKGLPGCVKVGDKFLSDNVGVMTVSQVNIDVIDKDVIGLKMFKVEGHTFNSMNCLC